MKNILKYLIYSLVDFLIYIEINHIFKRRIALHHLKNVRNLGDNASVDANSRILNPQYISIGNNFSAMWNLRLEAFNYFEKEQNPILIKIGNNVIMNTDIHIGAINSVIIGNNVLFASRIYISDHSHGEINAESITMPPSHRPLVSKGSVIIEDNVWIGEGVSILPNVKIGINAIIGANSVVTKDVPPNSVVAGVPAKIIKILN